MTVTAADIARVYRQPRVLHVSTSTLSRPSLTRATLALLRAAEGAFVVCDLNVRLRMWKSRAELKRAAARLVERAHLVKASEADLRAMGFSSFEAGLAWLDARAKAILVTRGPRAAELRRGGKQMARVTTRPVRVVDATGAGDGFLAGFLAVLLREKALSGTEITADRALVERALRFGHLVGGRVVTEIGSIEATRDARALRLAFKQA